MVVVKKDRVGDGMVVSDFFFKCHGLVVWFCFVLVFALSFYRYLCARGEVSLFVIGADVVWVFFL